VSQVLARGNDEAVSVPGGNQESIADLFLSSVWESWQESRILHFLVVTRNFVAAMRRFTLDIEDG
jgi:hypothetical protein